ncbi:MAG: hypothetical protein RL219_870 [Actinomycetota bacterium]|jgi:L-asparagine oxygenase
MSSPEPWVVDAAWDDPSPFVPDLAVNDPGFASAAGRYGRMLPPEVQDALVDFADESPTAGALLLRNVPIGAAIPPTPTTSIDTPPGKDRCSEFMMLAVARRLGQPVGYLPESEGSVVQNICPIASTEDRQVATSSKVDLVLHTEGSYISHKPRYVALLCLRGNPQAATTLATVSDIVEYLEQRYPHVIPVLWEPRFRLLVDETYFEGDESPMSSPVRVLRGDPAKPILVFDADLMRGDDVEAQAALDAVAEAAAAVRRGIVLTPGDLLVVDNHRAAHGRSSFAPRYDGTDRWLQRCFVVADITISDGERTGRVITTPFGL